MNLRKLRMVVLILLGGFMLVLIGLDYVPKDLINKSVDIDSTIIEKPIVDSIVDKDTLEYSNNNNFKEVKTHFYSYNKNIKLSTVKSFVNTAELFRLDTNKSNFDMYIGQILLESGAKHMRNDSVLMISRSGAIGLCQIMPNTCRGTMNKLSRYEKNNLEKLNVSDYSFINNDTLTKYQINDSCAVWLSNIKNNIAMWGVITYKSLNKHKNVYSQLVAYNMGEGGLNSYLKNNGNVSEHEYIQLIKSKLMTSK